MQVDLNHLLSLIDLTSLNDTDDDITISHLCKKAFSGKNHVAAICVYPRFVKQVKQIFFEQPIHIATVANFPHGRDTLERVRQIISDAINDGANEIDVVFPYTQFLSGDKVEAQKFIQECKKCCGENILLKVILETGALKELSIITEASRCVLAAGADFLKTSTGKIAIGATIIAAEAMLLVIKEFTHKLKRSFGFKASGGIRTPEQAFQYIHLAEKIMGSQWVTPDHFRLGASQLVDVLFEKIRDGNFPSLSQ